MDTSVIAYSTLNLNLILNDDLFWVSLIWSWMMTYSEWGFAPGTWWWMCCSGKLWWSWSRAGQLTFASSVISWKGERALWSVFELHHIITLSVSVSLATVGGCRPRGLSPCLCLWSQTKPCLFSTDSTLVWKQGSGGSVTFLGRADHMTFDLCFPALGPATALYWYSLFTAWPHDSCSVYGLTPVTPVLSREMGRNFSYCEKIVEGFSERLAQSSETV